MARKIVYHGTNKQFDIPMLSKCKDEKDFGKGFYLADDINHARAIALKNNFTGFGTSNAFLYSYEINIEELRKLGFRIHEFSAPNYSWLDFILKNRNMLKVDDFDIVIGHTADAAAQRDITRFYNMYGLNATNKEKDRLIKQIKPYVYGRQYCFKSQRAIDYLVNHFIGRRQVR